MKQHRPLQKYALSYCRPTCAVNLKTGNPCSIRGGRLPEVAGTVRVPGQGWLAEFPARQIRTKPIAGWCSRPDSKTLVECRVPHCCRNSPTGNVPACGSRTHAAHLNLRLCCTSPDCRRTETQTSERQTLPATTSGSHHGQSTEMQSGAGRSVLPATNELSIILWCVDAN